MNGIKIIVLSGGPCAGKTTSLAHIQERLTSRGFNVFIVPEAASIAILGGIANKRELSVLQVDFQISIIQLQMSMERAFLAAAGKAHIRTGKPSVVICDRGTLDGKAFCSPIEWQAVLDEIRTNDIYLRDKRYDAVVFLQSANEGYTTDNNPARKETVEEAAVFNDKLMRCWQPHEHFYLIRNRPNFQDKLHELDKVMAKITGLPAPMEYERKYLVKQTDLPSEAQIIQISKIIQTYIEPAKPGTVERVRSREVNGTMLYTHTTKKGHGVARVEEERRIDGREYLLLLERKLPGSRQIEKTRTTFLWHGTVYELDRFQNPVMEGHDLMEVELPDAETNPEIPEFITVVKDVTDDTSYTNFRLAVPADFAV